MIAKIRATVITRKHSNPTKKEYSKEKEVNKYFYKKLQSTADRSKDVLDVSLEKVDITCSSRMHGDSY